MTWRADIDPHYNQQQTVRPAWQSSERTEKHDAAPVQLQLDTVGTGRRSEAPGLQEITSSVPQ